MRERQFTLPDETTPPTAYTDVNAVLSLLCSQAQQILSQRLVGLYLYGSLASGDFDPQRSDIDFAAVTTGKLSDELISALEAMHARITDSGLALARKLEGVYMPQQDIWRHDDTAPPCPHINEGRFYLARYGSDWVLQRRILRESGVIVAGPPPDTLIAPVSDDDVRRAVAAFLREWWQPMLADPARLRSAEYQVYAILTMCRAQYTLRHGRIASKPVSARWAQRVSDTRWQELIEQALAWQPGSVFDRLDETLALIRHTVETGQR